MTFQVSTCHLWKKRKAETRKTFVHDLDDLFGTDQLHYGDCKLHYFTQSFVDDSVKLNRCGKIPFTKYRISKTRH